MTEAYEAYTQLQVLKRPLTGVYLSFFLMVTLMILVERDLDGPLPGQAHHAAGPAAGRRGARDRRRPPRPPRRARDGRRVRRRWSTRSTRWPTSWPTSRRQLERSTIDLQRKHAEVEERRRYIETILERIATGVVTVDAARADQHDQPRGVAAARPRARRRSASRPRRCSAAGPAAARRAAATLAHQPGERHGRRRRSRSCATAARCTWRRPPRRCTARAARAGGRVLVLDDITPLIRAQKVAAWREVARRLAHEIKNPLTPIQLCAERLRRQFAARARRRRALVDECTTTIVGEVESLKALVDEFSQFARMPAPRARADRPARPAARHAGALRRAVPGRAHRDAVAPCRCRRCGSTRSRSGGWSSTWWTTPSRRCDRQRRRSSSRRTHDAANGAVRGS